VWSIFARSVLWIVVCSVCAYPASAQCVSGTASDGTATPERTCSGANIHQQINYSFAART
jgi:hypothetical protein